MSEEARGALGDLQKIAARGMREQSEAWKTGACHGRCLSGLPSFSRTLAHNLQPKGRGFLPEHLKMPDSQSRPINAQQPAMPEPKGMLARLERRLRRFLGPRPVRQKLTHITMLTCTVATVIGGLLFFTIDIVSQFLTTRAALQSLGRVAAESSRDLLDARSTQALTSTLNALTEYPHVSGVMIYSADGNTLARPTRLVNAVLPASITPAPRAGTRIGLTSLSHREPMMRDGKVAATLVIEFGLSGLWERLRLHALISLGGILLVIALARLLLGRLRGMISDPIEEFTQVADRVAKDGNYALRAEKRGEDEVGRLVETFNNLLSDIQKRDAAISQAHTGLESNVMARTSLLQSEIQERRQAEEALKDSELRYRNLFENNPMPMWVMDLETLDFVAVNNAAVRHYGYDHAEFLLLSLPLITKDAEPLAVERAFRTTQKSFDGGEWKHRKRNGEVIEVRLTAHAIVFAGKVTKIVLAKDVTEQNRAQKQLEEMHLKLVEASRAAGMAEIATGVLHNVGNVLNSVNVSANLLADSVRKSKAASVRKVADLLDTNKADLPAFFSAGGKGQMMPGYLATLAQQIEAEQQGRLTEIEQLTKNIAHIKDIVAMQQDYAKISGVMQEFAPHALLDEALLMAETVLKRGSVTVEMDCPTTLPLVNTDRHKVLQILVNLISNAQQAMDDTPVHERRLTIGVTCQDGHASIAIRDSGCGIAKENLTRVFNHGFTTKPTGHGFGLHSAANAATEIAGSLTGESEGPGKGATFTLMLPLATAVTMAKAA